VLEKMVGATGFEPVTVRLKGVVLLFKINAVVQFLAVFDPNKINGLRGKCTTF